MHHVVELMRSQLLYELCLRRQIQFYEVDALVLQVLFRTAFAYGSPSLEALLERFLHDK